MKLEQKTKQFIEKFHMFEKGAGIIVGLSGGADSVALLEVLCELRAENGLRLAAVHVHHGIRKEAQQDVDFCKVLCEKKQVSFWCEYVDVPELAKKQGMSLEEAGRLARYEIFEKYRQQLNYDKIAVAHHTNDQAETMLFQLFRGTGLRGLAGMAASRDHIIRPLLGVSRQEIEQYLAEKNLDHVTDATNFSEIYTRNKIRHRIIPLAEEISPSAVEHMSNTAGQLREILDFMEEQADAFLEAQGNDFVLPLSELRSKHIALQKMIIMEALSRAAGSRKDITGRHIESILALLDKQGEKTLHLPKQVIIVKSYDSLCFRKGVAERESGDEKRYEIEPDRTYVLPDGTFLETRLILHNNLENISKNDCIKWFDYDKIIGTLFLRKREKGDYLTVRDDGARKSLQDYLVNEKVPREERDKVWVLAEDSHIMWVLGKRISAHYKVTAQTKRILQVRIGGKIHG